MMAQDTVGLLDGLGWGKVHVCGISMGGMISQELALLLGEERCLSLTLLATHAGGWLNKFPPIKGAKHFLKALTFDSKTDTEDVVENAIQMLYGSNTLNDPVSMELAREYHTRMIQIKKDFPITRNGMTGQMAAVASHGVTADRLRKIGAMKFKKLVVVGTEDNLVRHTNSKYIADHIGATYVEVQGHGHVITISYRDELNPLLDELWGGKGRFADTP
ncbi:hypothetical protein SARC_07495 [Sphaeroforma arctica JP610]|uniref:AB hydrolase-1 domain-containing protein n=1 Tax=Sphaeroforma arctica JP610 TaxID=667725 RepID=A0A0L0FW39_9EUKA|nr:hypothetical protein SARC_07495 [Sphaeroforma arctica JP610]KNC80143.1 hypothetical protein SARC_07495 [Sphaeroforma arctica JP610]|eukprot:XP_014154045.1 hypothetical protein SARC_07495 [Sphaeroforma arctica JP610]